MVDSAFMIRITGGVVRNADVRFRYPLNFTLEKGEHLVVTGLNGGGKTIFIDTLFGKYPLREGCVEYDFYPSTSNTVYENVKYISFRDVYGSADSDFCYMLRWNAHEQGDDLPTVRSLLARVCCEERLVWLLDVFSLVSLLDKRIILLSSGELRKFQIAMALAASPRLLVVDNPFIGLDAESRTLLVSVLERVVNDSSVQIVLVQPYGEFIPSFITHVVEVDGMSPGNKMCRDEYLSVNRVREVEFTEIKRRVLTLPEKNTGLCCDEVISFRNISVQYGSRKIFDSLSWTVRRGEVWAVTGRNGSGKSTLLSLVSADNLRSYACDISLFGRKRGSGESIWDIKKRIGYVSPEMHRGYMRNIPAIEIVASGLHDSIGLYVKSTQEELVVCEFWMELFGILHLKECSFLKLSDGEQRMVLLARAFVKDPELLILDEPLHGLDAINKSKVKTIVEAFSGRRNKTLIYVSHYVDELPSNVTNYLNLE